MASEPTDSGIDYEAVLHWARMNAPLSGSRVHGESHWIRVSENGIELARRIPGADRTVVRLFGFLHDCRRQNDFVDPGHGKRAAVHIQKIRHNLLANLTDDQFETLRFAVANHNTRQTSEDSTIGCCWDADRLEIGRVGMKVQKKYMSTDAGKLRAR